MAERVRSWIVSFMHPFRLAGMDAEQPAGAYRIESVEELLDSLTVTAYRRISTTIMLPAVFASTRSREHLRIEPADLEQALKRDALA